MALISNFEKQSRNSTAISLLNNLRRSIINSQEIINKHNKDMICKVLAILNGQTDIKDYISYHFRDSGKIENNTTFQVSKMLSLILTDENQKNSFYRLINNKINNKELANKDKEFIKKILESTIIAIDRENQNILTNNSTAEIKGF